MERAFVLILVAGEIASGAVGGLVTRAFVKTTVCDRVAAIAHRHALPDNTVKTCNITQRDGSSSA